MGHSRGQDELLECIHNAVGVEVVNGHRVRASTHTRHRSTPAIRSYEPYSLAISAGIRNKHARCSVRGRCV